MQISDQKKSDAIATLEMAIEAAKNSNSDGERAVMAAASGLRLLGALKRLMPELRRMHADRIISKEQFEDVERGILAAEGRDVAVASGSVPQPTQYTPPPDPPETSGVIPIWSPWHSRGCGLP